MKDFTNEFDKFKKMLIDKEPFAFTRFSDGEVFILQNKKLILGENYYVTGDKAGAGIYGPEERKNFDPEDKILQARRKDLIRSFEHKQHNYFKGIPSKQDIHIDLDFNYDKDEDLTFANLFINANYKRFIQEIVEEIFPRRRIIYIVNERADLRGLPFRVDVDFRIGEDCFKNNYNVINKVQNCLLGDTRDAIVLCSAASLSNLIIYHSYKLELGCTFLDIGSALNPYLGDKMNSCMHTRDYLRSYWMGEKNYYGNMIDEWK